MPGSEIRRPDGFRERGDRITRLETFVDAAFAFAVTLLLIEVGEVPESIPALIEALKRIPASAAAFTLLAMFWWAHNTWSRRYGLDDGPTLVLSLLYVFIVLVFVFPLRMLFEGLFAWVSGGLLPGTTRLGTVAELKAMYLTYGACVVALGLVLAALYAHALRCADALGLDAGERRETVGEIAARLWLAGNGLFSIVAALALPERAPGWVYALPGMAYFLMFLTAPVAHVAMRRWTEREGSAA